MGGFFSEIEKRMVCIFNSYTEMQRRQHEYCPGALLYPSEIHAIECIALTNPINMTELSRMLGMTKGGASKCIGKLENLKLVRRYKYIKNQKEVYLHLTDFGVEAFHGHQRYHQGMGQAIKTYGEGLTKEQGAEILRFLDIYLNQMQGLPTLSDNKSNLQEGE